MFREQSFTTKQIVETRAAALRCRAIVETRAITTWGICYIKDAANIRYNDDTQTGEVLVADSWVQIVPRGIAFWAFDENLNWLMPDGRVLRPDDPLYPAEGQS